MSPSTNMPNYTVTGASDRPWCLVVRELLASIACGELETESQGSLNCSRGPPTLLIEVVGAANEALRD